MNPKLLKLLSLSILILANTSCATILNPKSQKVQVLTSSQDSKVYIDNNLQGEGTSVRTKMDRDQTVRQIRIERPGYKDIYDTHYQDRKSPWHIMSWVPFIVTFYAPFVDYGPKSYDYKREKIIEEKPVRIYERNNNTKYVFLKNTSFDVKKEDLKFKLIKKRKFEKNKEKYKRQTSSKEDINYDNTIFSEALNEILVENNFADTTNTIFRKKNNTAYLSAKIKKVEFEEVYEMAARSYKSFIYSNVEIEWSIHDLYDQIKFEKTINSKSGKFCNDYGVKNLIKDSMNDAIESSFFEFFNLDEVINELIITEKEEVIIEDYITINEKEATSIEEAINSTVTIKVNKGHGSGCVISTDGYIITNFHVVSGENNEIEILTKDDRKLKAELIRKSEEFDLALLKVDGSFENTYKLPNEKQYKIGQDVFAIGTPSNIDLGQTLSKGIISGFRTKENLNYLQTDASVNPGNSGGALINKKGQLIGIVNAKILGLGVEGLAFAIPAEKIKKILYIK